MKNSSQEAVRNLFSLPKTEKVYDDFGCAYSKQILYHGRLFLTENYLCFNSNILGFKTKLLISLQNIKEVKRTKVLGLFNNTIDIVVTEANKTKTHVFTSFNSRNMAYKRIKLVVKNYQRVHNTKNGGGNTSSSDSEELEVEDLRGKARSVMSESLEDGSKNSDEIYFPEVDPEKYFELFKVQFNMTPVAFYEKFFGPNAEFSFTEFYNFQGHSSISVGEWKEVESDTNTSINERISTIEQNNSAVKNDPGLRKSKTTIIESDLRLSNVTDSIPEKTESVAVNPLVTSNVVLKPGKTFIREINMIVKVHGVLFLNETRVNKVQKVSMEGDKVIIVGNNNSLDVPYSSYFYVEDKWEVVPFEGDKCLVRVNGAVMFHKATVFKNKIETKTKEELKKDSDTWLAEVVKKGISYENFNSIRKRGSSQDDALQHGVEKNIDVSKLPIPHKIWHNYKEKTFDYAKKNKILVIGAVLFLILLFYLQRIYSLLVKIDRDNYEINKNYNDLNQEVNFMRFNCLK